MGLGFSDIAISNNVISKRLLLACTALLIAIVGTSVEVGVIAKMADQKQARIETSQLHQALAWQLARTQQELLETIAIGNDSVGSIQKADAAPVSSSHIIMLPDTIGAGGVSTPLVRTGLAPVMARSQEILAPLRLQNWDGYVDSSATGSITSSGGKARQEFARVKDAPSGFINLAGKVYAAAGATGADGAMQVGLKPVNAAFLQAVQLRAGVAPLHLISGEMLGPKQSASAPAAIISLSSDGKAGAVTWAANRPGLDLLIRYGLLLLGLTILVAATVIFYAYMAIRKLRASEAETRRLAGFDTLTQLPNRSQFGQFLDAEFARSARGGGPFALLSLDIDRLKEINDSCGHEAGDRMIVGVVARVAQTLRAGDKLARIDGDEFAVLQTEIAGPKDCEELANRILEALREPIDLGNLQIRGRLSIGVAMQPVDALNREDLMRAAASALALAKKDGRDRYVFFEKMLGEDMRARRDREEELRKAIDSGSLLVQYQPIMHVDGERLSCVEALVRWPHPLQGLVPPDQFISLAEDRGLIIPLGEFVLRQACRDGKRWPGIRVAVNVSPIQFRQKDFAKMVERVLEEEQFDPSRLELELTEGVVIADADEAENIMFELRSHGIRLALDDFGTGYSSLVYLRRFAFDKIKIDKSFLEATESTGESAIILHSLIHLGRALGLTVTAEGIETPEQHRFLQAAGVHELQGYLFSRPVPRESIDRMLGLQYANSGEVKSVA
ncbi:MAG: bifunctional diguanylate cyclase/phosphodiesterase [Hyphomicrobiales bacterium]|nr:bifunctional diguanylate cyclase/phosphodiesterase [Hyphomicrobiales bacterium]MDE2115348.1 GGDEF domain-containing protein [Hyphomicrobiales bacterium]